MARSTFQSARSCVRAGLVAAIVATIGMSAGAAVAADPPSWFKQPAATPAERRLNTDAGKTPRPSRAPQGRVGPERPFVGPRPPARAEPRPAPGRQAQREHRADHRRHSSDRDHRKFGSSRHDAFRHGSFFGPSGHARFRHGLTIGCPPGCTKPCCRPDLLHRGTRAGLFLHFGSSYYHRYRDPYDKDVYIYNYTSPILSRPLYEPPPVAVYDLDTYSPGVGGAIIRQQDTDGTLSQAEQDRLDAERARLRTERAERAWSALANAQPSMSAFAELLVIEPENPMHRIGYAIGAARSGQPARAEWAIHSALSLDATALLAVPERALPAARQAAQRFAEESRDTPAAAITLSALRLAAGQPTAAAEALVGAEQASAEAESLRRVLAEVLQRPERPAEPDAGQ